MSPEVILEISKEAILTLLLMSLPLLLVALLVGLTISLFQALTQIQEPTLSFVPKIIAIFVTLFLSLGYMGDKMNHFTEEIVNQIINPD